MFCQIAFARRKDPVLRALLIAVLGLAALPATAERFELGQPVPGQAGKTWFDAVKLVVPDLIWQGDNATGATSIPLRSVDSNDNELASPEAEFIVHGVDVEPLLAEGRALTLVSFGLGPAAGWAAEIEALAVFDENLALLDAINIGQDKLNEIRGTPIRISAADEAVLTYSEHFNSNQTYGLYALLMVKDGKFQTIDIVGTLGDRWCGHERTQALAVSSQDAGIGYWPITVTVTAVQKATADKDCGDEVRQPGFERTYATTYNWSASMGVYVTEGEGFAALAEENSERY